MIGLNILYNPDIFMTAFNNGDDIAVHTWTHPYLTSLPNEAVVAELGYAMQIIHDSTGGRIPRFWRPPYGDADNRIRAIAKNIFGLTMVMWNQEYVIYVNFDSRLTWNEVPVIGVSRLAVLPRPKFYRNCRNG
jgi:chitin deacetylase